MLPEQIFLGMPETILETTHAQHCSGMSIPGTQEKSGRDKDGAKSTGTNLER